MPDGKPLVTIITPVLNGAKFLDECIQSVLRQTYSRIEHIFVDGGSTDGTLEILSRYQAQYPSRFKFYLEPQSTNGEAWNFAYQASQGSILGWIGSDDFYVDPRVVEEVVEFFASRPEAYFIHGHCHIVNEKSEIFDTFKALDYTVNQIINYGNPVAFPSAFYRRELIAKIGLFDTNKAEIVDGNDLDFVIRAAKASRLYPVDRVYSCFRVHKNSRTTGADTRTVLKWKKLDCELSRRHGGRFFSGYRKRYYKAVVLALLKSIFTKQATP